MRAPRDETATGPLPGARTGENAIETSGFWGPTPGRGPRSYPPTLLALVVLLFLASSCGGGDEKAQQPPPPDPAKAGDPAKGGDPKAGAPAQNAPGGATVESTTNAETLEDSPFELNQEQPIPTDFRAAYQRRALLVVEFFQEGEDPLYPQGLDVDESVNEDLSDLRGEYPQIEFFTYEISEPGNAETSEDLDRGQYGTLAAQLEVGFTPFVAMLAPRGEQYVVENLFQGYVEEGVLEQALFDLSRADVGGNSSDVDVSLDRVERTTNGSGIEYVTVVNEGDDEVDLSGFRLTAVDPATGGPADGGARGAQISDPVRVAPDQRISIGRDPDLNDADGNRVAGTFQNGDTVSARPGDQVALVDNGGAVIDTITL